MLPDRSLRGSNHHHSWLVAWFYTCRHQRFRPRKKHRQEDTKRQAGRAAAKTAAAATAAAAPRAQHEQRRQPGKQAATLNNYYDYYYCGPVRMLHRHGVHNASKLAKVRLWEGTACGKVGREAAGRQAGRQATRYTCRSTQAVEWTDADGSTRVRRRKNLQRTAKHHPPHT